MQEELLFSMLEDAVEQAADLLVSQEGFEPFALALMQDDKVVIVDSKLEDSEAAYEEIWQDLKAKSDEYKGVVIAIHVQNPEGFSLSQTHSIRVHVENAHNKYEKVAARFLYIPYALFKNEQGQAEISLDQPKPVAFSHEIFVS